MDPEKTQFHPLHYFEHFNYFVFILIFFSLFPVFPVSNFVSLYMYIFLISIFLIYRKGVALAGQLSIGYHQATNDPTHPPTKLFTQARLHTANSYKHHLIIMRT